MVEKEEYERLIKTIDEKEKLLGKRKNNFHHTAHYASKVVTRLNKFTGAPQTTSSGKFDNRSAHYSAEADRHRKDGRYDDSYDALKKASIDIDTYTGGDRNKINEIIQRRLIRLVKDITSERNPTPYNLEVAREAIKLGEKLVKEPKKISRGLENTIATTALVGIIGGITALSFNAKTIQLSPGTNVLSNSNFVVGIIFLAIGILAGFFWIKPKIKKKKRK